MKLYMARHGETDWNRQLRIQGQTDTDLNENGRNQAVLLGENLKNEKLPVTKIYSSPQKRALETAAIVSKMLEVPCVEMKGLQEINFGAWEGHTWEEVKAQYPEQYHHWHVNRRTDIPPEGESYQQLLERVIAALRQIIEQEQQEEKSQQEHIVLVVAHSAVIMSLQCFLHGDPFQDMVSKYRTKNSAFVELSVSQIMSKEVTCSEKSR